MVTEQWAGIQGRWGGVKDQWRGVKRRRRGVKRQWRGVWGKEQALKSDGETFNWNE